MKAVLCKTLDGPASLMLEDIAEPRAASGEVIVRVAALGMNFADTLITRGKYQFKPELPFSPGAEIAGIVESLGDGVTGWQPGDRILAYINWGGAREKVAVKASALIAVPDAVSDTMAAGLSVTYGTAMHGLVDRGRIATEETVVVTGASGGAGLAAVECAKLLGARVIAIASSDVKLQIARDAGADDGIVLASNMTGVDFKDIVKAKTGGVGADIVYDCVGGETAEPLVRALAWKGRFLVVGFAAGEIPKIPINLLLLKGAEISGVFWGDFVKREPQAHAANMRKVLSFVAEGKLTPRTHATYPLEKYKDAIDVLERREATGKVIVTL